MFMLSEDRARLRFLVSDILVRAFATAIAMIFCTSAMAQDWSYELNQNAKLVYAKKEIKIPCSAISKFLYAKNNESIYLAIRDAALFRNSDCKKFITKHRQELNKIPGVADAVAFYEYRMGDESALHRLARSFDADARRSGQGHWTVEIFGFIGDWEIAGRRLVRHASYSDGAGSEVLCSAIRWRRYLYGEIDFETNWFVIGKQENVRQERLQDKFDFCRS